jgi:uncharacterized protein YjbJ (UPF0337 family)
MDFSNVVQTAQTMMILTAKLKNVEAGNQSHGVHGLNPRRRPMNKDRVKGTVDEVAGIAKRKAGELTGNTQLRVEGMVQQVKGKVENAWGKAKDAVQDANEEAAIEHETRIEVALECAASEDKTGKKRP